jgi:hypothetical protein
MCCQCYRSGACSQSVLMVETAHDLYEVLEQADISNVMGKLSI